MNHLFLICTILALTSCRLVRGPASSSLEAAERPNCSRDFLGISVGTVARQSVTAQDGKTYKTNGSAVMAVGNASLAWLMGFEMTGRAHNSPQGNGAYKLSTLGDKIVGVFTGNSLNVEEIDSNVDLVEYLRDRCRRLTWAGVRLVKSDPDLALHYTFDLSGRFFKHSNGQIFWAAESKPPKGAEVDKERRLDMLNGVRASDSKKFHRASAKEGLEIAERFWQQSSVPREVSCHDNCSIEYEKRLATRNLVFLNRCRACCTALSQSKICERSGYPFE